MKKQRGFVYGGKLRFLSGFTMVETLLVIALLSVISLALYNTLANGIKVWERGNRTIAEEDVVVFFEKLNYDLKNSFIFSKINFEGKSNRLAFPTLIKTLADSQSTFEKKEYIPQIGKVEYFFDGVRKNLYRREARYGQALKGDFGADRLLVKDVRFVRFEYFYDHHRKLEWEDEIEYQDSEKKVALLPLAVKCSLGFGQGTSSRSISEIINIPLQSVTRDE